MAHSAACPPGGPVTRLHRRFGYRRLHILLKREGYVVGPPLRIT
jgi:hypothetical protein